MVNLVAANHTGHELELMLAGRKPLAMFYEDIGFLPDERFIPEAEFAPHVASGHFIRGETTIETADRHPTLDRNIVVKFVFFAVQREEWRIPAMSLLLHAREKGGWNETCERVESALLGYTQEEIDAWCRSRYRPTT